MRPVPMSEKLPRVPLNVPKLARFVRLNAVLGSANCGSLVRLFTSHRSSNFDPSVILNSFERETWVQRSPGASKVFLPRVPVVNAAGYANALKLKYRFWAL